MSEKVLIDRKLLADLLSQDRETRINAERSLYAQLANTTIPQPAAVEAVEVVGWLQTDATRQSPVWLSRHRQVSERSIEEGALAEPVMTVARHNRIMAATVPAGCKVVPVGLLERTLTALDECAHLNIHYEAAAELRAILEMKDERG